MPAEGERDAGGYRECFERWLVECGRPIRFVDRETTCVAAILAIGIERDRRLHCGIVIAHGREELRAVDAFHFVRERFERVGAQSRRLLHPVFVAQEMQRFAVEHLPRDLLRLFHHREAAFHIRIHPEVGTFVEEPLAGL